MENKRNKQSNALLGDLKSIQADLLDQSQDQQDREVPLLDDVVPDATPIDASTPPNKKTHASTDSNSDHEKTGLEDATIWALLGDEWKQTSDEAVERIQKAVDQNESLWRGQDTDALNKSLKVRIDQTLHAWLQETVSNNIESLRKTLLNALTDEIDRRMSEIDVNDNKK